MSILVSSNIITSAYTDLQIAPSDRTMWSSAKAAKEIENIRAAQFHVWDGTISVTSGGTSAAAVANVESHYDMAVNSVSIANQKTITLTLNHPAFTGSGKWTTVLVKTAVYNNDNPITVFVDSANVVNNNQTQVVIENPNLFSETNTYTIKLLVRSEVWSFQ